jgi:hypothetical protein
MSGGISTPFRNCCREIINFPSPEWRNEQGQSLEGPAARFQAIDPQTAPFARAFPRLALIGPGTAFESYRESAPTPHFAQQISRGSPL